MSTDHDGAFLDSASTHLRTSMDSLRDAALQIGTSPTANHREAFYWTAGEEDIGHGFRIMVGQSSRAGDAYAIWEIEVEYELVGEHQIRAEEY